MPNMDLYIWLCSVGNYLYLIYMLIYMHACMHVYGVQMHVKHVHVY